MREVKSLIIICAVLSLFNVKGNAQKFHSLDNIPHDISYYRKSRVTKPIVKVVYGRSQKNGRKVFGDLVAYDKIWRTGANEATEVKFYQDVFFGNKKVKAGTYVLYTIPNEHEWEVILSSNVDVFGAFQYDPIFNVASVRIAPIKAEELEAFSIGFKEQNETIEMVLGWDTTRAKIPIKINSIASNEYAGI